MDWHPTREAALDRLETFAPHAGKAYASRRNLDTGDAQTDAVSRLSPYLQRRLISEEEVVRRVLAEHDPRAAEKFLQEVCWRTYWKGWLAMRPRVWDDWRAACDAYRDVDRLTPEQQACYPLAVRGETGIDAFDAWVQELARTGYLHNHARMNVASIWIHTLGLPWELGAHLFFGHLLDADAASNTLSWRWVAGRHTPGKAYLANVETITACTNGRFNPAGRLRNDAPELPEVHHPDLQTIDWMDGEAGDGPYGLLLTLDDASLETTSLRQQGFDAVAVWQPGRCYARNERVHAFNRAVLADTAARAMTTWGGPRPATLATVNDVVAWANQHALRTVVAPYPHIGPRRSDILAIREQLAADGRSVLFHVRDWDRRLFPHATRGYFRFKRHLPELFREMRV
jgi:hypothetical protein